jgi:hypothetical protein
MYPWEKHALGVADAPSLEETVKALQANFTYAVKMTAVLVRSSDERLCLVVNTERGPNIPVGVCKFTDGTTVEMVDIGMPQPGIPSMTVDELARLLLQKTQELGLEIA